MKDIRPVYQNYSLSYNKCRFWVMWVVVTRLPHCVRADAAAEKSIMVSREFVGYSDLTLLVSHAVSMIPLEQKTFYLSTARWPRYNTVLLDMLNIPVKHCRVLNLARLLTIEEDGEGHNCVAVMDEVCFPHPDLSEMPWSNSDLVLFVNGSTFCILKTRHNQAGYLVVTQHEVFKSGSQQSHYSAQAAELVSLTEACKLAKNLTNYSDSRWAFGVVQNFGALWKTENILNLALKSSPVHARVLLSVSQPIRDSLTAGLNAKLCVAKHFFPHFAKLTHGLDHIEAHHWFTKWFTTYAQKYCKARVTCVTHTISRWLQLLQIALTPPVKPFDHLRMEFSELTPSECKK